MYDEWIYKHEYISVSTNEYVSNSWMDLMDSRSINIRSPQTFYQHTMTQSDTQKKNTIHKITRLASKVTIDGRRENDKQIRPFPVADVVLVAGVDQDTDASSKLIRDLVGIALETVAGQLELLCHQPKTKHVTRWSPLATYTHTHTYKHATFFFWKQCMLLLFANRRIVILRNVRGSKSMCHDGNMYWPQSILNRCTTSCNSMVMCHWAMPIAVDDAYFLFWVWRHEEQMVFIGLRETNAIPEQHTTATSKFTNLLQSLHLRFPTPRYERTCGESR